MKYKVLGIALLVSGCASGPAPIDMRATMEMVCATSTPEACLQAQAVYIHTLAEIDQANAATAQARAVSAGAINSWFQNRR